MSDILSYLQWRGDILFSQLPVNDVDALIFSILAYIRFDGIVPETTGDWIPLRRAAGELFALPNPGERARVAEDLRLLEAAAKTDRFGGVSIGFYQNTFIPEEETQFAAVSFLTDDGTAFLAFRGTDDTLVGWKEDFNMTFRESVPAQRLAHSYTEQFARSSRAPLRLGGHSKGGNLAVYAGAKCDRMIQNRIMEVFNHDGPGFTEQMMTDPGYLRIVPKAKTFVPQSSVFGMLLEHEEPYMIIRSRQIGLMQHDPHSWMVSGKEFLYVQTQTADSRFLDKTIKTWLAGLSPRERGEFVDTVFALLMVRDASELKDVLRPQNLRAMVKGLSMDETKRKMIGAVLTELVEAAKSTYAAMSAPEVLQTAE